MPGKDDPMVIESNLSLARRAGVLTVGKILQSVMSLFATIYMAHVLGPVDFGVLGFTAAITSYFGLASTLGIPILATREISQLHDDDEKQGLIVGDVMMLTGILSLGSYTLLWSLTPIFTVAPTLRAILLISGLQVLINSLSPQWASAGIQRTDFNAGANIIGTIIRVGLVFLIIHSPRNLEAVPVLGVIGTLITVAIEWWLLKQTKPIHCRPSWTRLWSIFRRALPMTTASAMMQAYSSLDTIFLGYWDGLGVVGYYNAAYKLVLFLGSFTSVYNQVIFPLATRLYHSDVNHLKVQLRRSLSITTIITLPIILGGSWLASPIIRTIFGDRFEAADPLLRILLWTWGITFATLHYGPVLIACNQERRFARGIALGGAVNLAANLVTVPLWGAIGAALSILFTELVILSYMMYYMTHQVGWYGPSIHTILGVILSCAVMLLGLDLFSRQLGLFEAIGFGSLLYSASLILTRTVHPAQLKWALRLLGP